ncbi:DUF4382 domain-containing protein [Pseudoalteromonas sp. JBTF-M23]|uniref:DUF4382 domain-containing protein n=1 Tax=Pseudoalteromonas caenipelagi TaxID=2726988 RepID=A0A849V7V1_9GAMM|nr:MULTISPECIES: DUF4382 domain-containing protein [Pseudoalteromonas]MBD1581364.1 DUF4382 domain-containing protein [Pseudoalteromonas sp. S16_S37]NOU49412.1 DUF4382 domain-containing protein [Pseudoalteromonas caenipelagi]
MNKLTNLLSITAAIILGGCGGSSDSSSSAAQTTPTVVTTTMSLGVSDAPVSNVKAVNVMVDGVVLQKDDARTSYETKDENGNPIIINLLDYSGDKIFPLLDSVELESGEYQWLRANIVNGSSVDNLSLGSHLVYNDDSQVPLDVKRKGSDGVGEIQINNVVVNEGANSFVLEFDLNRSLVAPQSGNTVFLKPTAIRLENTAQTFTVSGSVSEELKSACIADNSELAPEQGQFKHVIYLYDEQAAQPSDIFETDPVDSNSPIATATLEENNEFAIAFIEPATYQIAYSCLGHLDDVEVQDVDFSLYQLKSQSVSQNTTVAFETTP